MEPQRGVSRVSAIHEQTISSTTRRLSLFPASNDFYPLEASPDPNQDGCQELEANCQLERFLDHFSETSKELHE